MSGRNSAKRTLRAAKRQPKARGSRAVSAAVGWREIALALACVEIAIFVLVLDPSVRDVFDLPKATFTHALAWVLLGVLVVVALVDGVRVPVSPLFLAFYAMLATELLTTASATNQYVAVFGEVGRYLGLTTHAVLALVAITIALATDYPRRAAWLAWTVGGIAVAASAYAIAQALGADPITWVDLDSKARPFATLGNPDFYGQFLSVVVIASAAALVFAGAALGRLRWAVAALGAESAVLMVIVATRGSVIGVIAGLLVIGVLWLRRTGASCLSPRCSSRSRCMPGAERATRTRRPSSPPRPRSRRITEAVWCSRGLRASSGSPGPASASRWRATFAPPGSSHGRRPSDSPAWRGS